ncbi:lipid II:glycine glycyltransferase FemX [Candidatus Hydrogenedentota bacterium]
MCVYRIDPHTDERWPAFIKKRPDASIFHTSGWMKALEKTYAYKPTVYTTSPPGEELTNGIPFCEIKSWFTGTRLVSLPFSDHCEPLVENEGQLVEILKNLSGMHTNPWKYIELRPSTAQLEHVGDANGFGRSTPFLFHRIDISGDIDEVRNRLHKDAIRRKIRRAEREKLVCRYGFSDDLLDSFYRLLLMTRRKHMLPPQPRIWFRNLLDCLGDHTRIMLAEKDNRPVAAILVCNFGLTHYYKYGCSDLHAANLGGTPLLMWRAIQRAKEAGATSFDLGRSDIDNEGLAKFKERLGAVCSKGHYLRSPALSQGDDGGEGWKMRVAKRLFSRLPDKILVAAGKVLYRHIG